MPFNAEQLAIDGIRHLQPYIPGKPVDELERELGITNSIKLASNENPLGASSKAKKAAFDAIADMHIYPDGSAHKLRELMANDLDIQPNQLTYGNGSNDVLELLARVFLNDQRSCVFSEYAFAVYPIVTQAIGAKANIAKALPSDHEDMPYGHDLDALLAAIDETTRLLFIANPNNPTGTWLNPHTLYQFLLKVPNDVIVVLDEAYYEYLPSDLQCASIDWINEFPNLVITRTFSKIYALSGLRIGYAISHPDIADLLNRARQPFNANSVALAAAEAAWQDKLHLQRSKDNNDRGLIQLAEGVQSLDLKAIPSVANFITVEFETDTAKINEALLHEGFIVRPVANYNLPKHLRISVGTEQQNKKLISVLSTLLNAND